VNNSTIAIIVADYLRAGLSRQQIAQRLNQRGFRTHRGNLWSPTSMKRIWSAVQVNNATEKP
jgi:hypothetical protein